jgi:uncharacterized protein (TIGR00725 family)
VSDERPPLIGVCGAAEATSTHEEQAEEVGRLLAQRGAVVVCGGYEGVMCAAARGARQAGGTSIGLLASDEPSTAAEEVGIAIPLGLGELANAVLPRACRGIVAIGPGYGTLSEISHAIKLGRPVVALGSWRIQQPDHDRPDETIEEAATPEEAVRRLYRALERGANGGS